MAGRCYVELGLPSAPSPVVRCLGALRRAHGPRTGAVHSWLAEAQIGVGDVEAAVTSANRVLELTEQISSVRSDDRANLLRRKLKPYKDVPVVQEFEERIREMGSLPRPDGRLSGTKVKPCCRRATRLALHRHAPADAKCHLIHGSRSAAPGGTCRVGLVAWPLVSHSATVRITNACHCWLCGSAYVGSSWTAKPCWAPSISTSLCSHVSCGDGLPRRLHRDESVLGAVHDERRCLDLAEHGVRLEPETRARPTLCPLLRRCGCRASTACHR